MTEFVTPNIRTVLKTYQSSATNSLQGPGQSLPTQNPNATAIGLVGGAIIKKEPISSPEPPEQIEPPAIPLRPPELPQPILTAADPGRGELYQTELEGKPIGCFLLGGEMRLCLPQFLNNVLNDFSLEQINRIFDELRIFCSQCTPGQLMEFKAAKILPDDVKASGLITRTNAERLCSALIHRSEMRASNIDIPKGAISFKVYHRCFGKCDGVCTPELYTTYLNPACIMCLECNGMFTPQKFVGHVHRQKENRTCHWGFDSRNWRDYMHVAYDAENREKYAKMLDEMRDMEQQERRDAACLKRKAEMMEESLIVMPPTSCKRGDPASIDIPSKKSKMIDESYLLEYQRYQALLYAQAQYAQHEQLSAFRPWTPKPPFLPYSTVAAAAVAAANLPYLSQEPPVLQNPERVVRHTESERFERTFQPNVALAPRKSILSKERERERELRERERERERDRSMAPITTNLAETEIHIKQECPTSPELLAQSSPEEMCIASPTSNNNHLHHQQQQQQNVSQHSQQQQQHHSILHQLHLLEQQSPHSQCTTTTTTISLGLHQQQQQQQVNNSNSAPISPEEFSGSNEITSSTSPVPNTNRSCTNSASTTPTPMAQQQQQQQQQQYQQSHQQQQHQESSNTPTGVLLTSSSINHSKTADNNNMIVCVPNRIHINNTKLSNSKVRSPTPPPSIREQYNKIGTNLNSKQRITFDHHHQQQPTPQQQQQSPQQLHQSTSSSASTTSLSSSTLSSNVLMGGGGGGTNNTGSSTIDGIVIKRLTNGIALSGNSEFELSTDTDDDSLTGEPDSSNMPPGGGSGGGGPWEIASDALKNIRAIDRDKVMHIIRTLMDEIQRLRHCGIENVRLNDELQRRDEQIAQLREELYHVIMQQSTAAATTTSTNISPTATIKVEKRSTTPHHQSHSTEITANSAINSVITKAETSGCSGAVTHNDVTITPTYNYPRHKCDQEPIRVPLKKSSRRSPEDTVVVLNHNHHHHRDEKDESKTISPNGIIKNSSDSPIAGLRINGTKSPVVQQQVSPMTTTTTTSATVSSQQTTSLSASSLSSSSSSSLSSTSSSDQTDYDISLVKQQQQLQQQHPLVAGVKCD